MSQLSLFDLVPASEPDQPVPVAVVEPEPEEPTARPDSTNQTETSMPWRSFVGGRWTPYEEPTHPTDAVRLTGRCGHCRASFVFTVALAELDTDVIYCLHLGGSWEPQHRVLCWTCAKRVCEFLIKLLR